jgi:hypothetical protein
MQSARTTMEIMSRPRDFTSTKPTQKRMSSRSVLQIIRMRSMKPTSGSMFAKIWRMSVTWVGIIATSWEMRSAPK